MSLINYEYRAMDRAGAAAHGYLLAATPQDAFRRLAATGLTPIRLRPARDKSSRFALRAKRVSAAEIARFTYQFAVLLEARLPIVECLRGIAEQEANDRFRKVIEDIGARVQSGVSITAAIEPHRRLFGDVYVETIRAAERSGNIVTVLNHLAEAVEEQQEMRRTVRGALMYPVTVVVALTIATLFLLVFVVPRFASMFASRGIELPLITQALMGLGTSLRDAWWVYAGLIALLALGVRTIWGNPQGRAWLDRYLNRIPVLGRLLTGLAVGRFASVFGLSLASGLGLIDCLEMAGRASGRPLLMNDVSKMVNQVRQGGRLSGVLHTCGYLPAFARQLLRAGEESAELSRMCRIIARQYARETKYLCKNAATIMEPVLIAGLTGVVLLVALAIFLPMWNMISLIG